MPKFEELTLEELINFKNELKPHVINANEIWKFLEKHNEPSGLLDSNDEEYEEVQYYLPVGSGCLNELYKKVRRMIKEKQKESHIENPSSSPNK